MSGLLFFPFKKKEKENLSALRFLVLGQYKKHLLNLPLVLRSHCSRGERVFIIFVHFLYFGCILLQLVRGNIKIEWTGFYAGFFFILYKPFNKIHNECTTFLNIFVAVQFAVHAYIYSHANSAPVCVFACTCVQACVLAVKSLVTTCSSFRCLHC